MECLRNIYNSLRDKNEIAIYDKYGMIGKRITVLFTSKENIYAFLLIELFIAHYSKIYHLEIDIYLELSILNSIAMLHISYCFSK